MRLLAFAQAQDQLGYHERFIEVRPEETPRDILARVAPALQLEAMRVAVDLEYRDWDDALGEATEMALIPPVSGG